VQLIRIRGGYGAISESPPMTARTGSDFLGVGGLGGLDLDGVIDSRFELGFLVGVKGGLSGWFSISELDASMLYTTCEEK
jgi:hypothetical protein